MKMKILDQEELIAVWLKTKISMAVKIQIESIKFDFNKSKIH